MRRSWCWSPKQDLIWSPGAVFSPLHCLASLQKCYKVGPEEDILPSQHIYIFAVMRGYSVECWQASRWSSTTAESGHLGLGFGSLPCPYRPILSRENIMALTAPCVSADNLRFYLFGKSKINLNTERNST